MAAAYMRQPKASPIKSYSGRHQQRPPPQPAEQSCLIWRSYDGKESGAPPQTNTTNINILGLNSGNQVTLFTY